RNRRDRELLVLIRKAFSDSRHSYGSRRIHAVLMADGERISERRIARIMRENDISPKKTGPQPPVTTRANHK
ncbi:IS3 family transposase, partial [Roseibium sp. RKSG952]|uniref:IS3 family transposase n=1 Tax=Roseibium sp. RKSG952 TaxID=2529384 RepID=UPI0012BD46C3